MKTKDRPGSPDIIKKTFSDSVRQYHESATIQKSVAKGLISSLEPWADSVPPGKIIEIGAGTGFLTELLIDLFPNRKIIVTDLSGKMIEFCESRLKKSEQDTSNVSFQTFDANDIESIKDNQFSLIISNFAAQWFEDIPLRLEELGNLLVPGGYLLFSFPGEKTFTEWYEKCLELGLPYTANEFPNVEELVIKLSTGPFQIDYYENDIQQNFDSAFHFFKHLKEIGADASKKGTSLSLKQFKMLDKYWTESAEPTVSVTWHIVYLAAKKDY